jgi:hypothetical protein
MVLVMMRDNDRINGLRLKSGYRQSFLGLFEAEATID